MSPYRLIRALLRQPVDRTPVWLMRQAGRYLPEYRALRANAGDFMTLCKTPELACEITLQPLQRFPLDGAILFSDILTVPDAMGLGLHFITGEGPRFQRPITNAADIQQLPVPDPMQTLRYVMDAITLIKPALGKHTPLIGFAGSPWTLATYMLEGGKSDNFSKAKTLLYAQPALLHQLLEKLTQATILYLNAQIAAGVDAVMLFDTWGGILTTPAYREFSLHYLQKIVAELQREKNAQHIPCIIFCKQGGQWLTEMADTGCDALGVDWTVNLAQARQKVGERVALQGNLDPALLYTAPEIIEKEVARILKDYGKHTGHVFNLGHGVPQNISPDNVAALINAVHTLSVPYHS